jgi:manganese/iron transport system permease protein
VGRLIEPLQYPFMQTGLLAAMLVGVTCAVLGVYVVLRSMAFIGDALAHTILPGLVAAYLLGLNLLLGAVVAGVATAFGIGWLSRRETLREDTAIGITFTGMFALGILLMSTANSFRDFTHMLFGNILGITPADLALISGLALLVLVVLFVFHKELELTSFDPTHARVMGLRADRVRYGLLILLSLTVVAGIQAVGVVLISALLITPAAAASLLTRSLPRMMFVSAAIAVFSGVAGLYASYYFNVASGAAIVLSCTACFVVASVVAAIRRRLATTGSSEADHTPASIEDGTPVR